MTKLVSWWLALGAVGLALAWMVRARVADGALDLTTGLLLMGAAWIGLFLLVEWTQALWGVSAQARSRMRLTLVTTVLLVVGLELFARFGLGTYTTYFERNGATVYSSISEHTGPSWFHIYSPDVDVTWTTADFVHVRRTNSLGLSEREIPVEKPVDEYRIVVLGDSYTEGVGADYETTWVKVMESALAAHWPDRRIITYNAGISGSDPLFAYMLLREKLVAYAPNLVLAAVNTTDVEDILLRGGMERFQPDGTYLSPRTPPSWEWLYGVSYLSRHVVHDILGYDRFFISRSQQEPDRRRAVEEIYAAVPAFAELGLEHEFRFATVFHPNGEEIVNGAYSYDFDAIIDALRTEARIEVIDMMPHWRDHLRDTGRDQAEFFWPTDGHHTPEGYGVMGRAIASDLVALELVEP